MITELYRCRQCGHDHDDYSHLHHPSPETGGFCANCGGDDLVDVTVAFAQGDGSMAELMRNGQCPKCRTDMGGDLTCGVCGLEIVQ